MDRVGREPSAGQKFGFTDEELATMSTVYRDGLLDGKVVVVSGGGSGIGKGIAFLCARLGAQVVICGRTEEKLVAACTAMEKAAARRPLHIPMSVREPEQVDEFFDKVFDKFGKVDHLINNAGGQFPQNAIDFSRKGWQSVIDLNLNGTWWMTQTLAQKWREAGVPGNVISIVANVERGMPQAAHTCAARAGVIYLSKTLATEWAPLGIRVNCVAPGVIESEGFRVYPPEALARFHDANPMKRRGNVWDIAEACVYLMAPSADFITGELLVIDGGQAQNGAVWPAGRPDWFGGVHSDRS
ncbi:SDR family oxidoreductase [Aurantiacibacter odishensis]|uniref:SDR family oxidoreductase n=1 Tax=Aurantiacibacter odishensis TaxID=1155476 RepID=UPI001F0C05F6|nr:SDR family oxidoreductase [Aurantiacibacter odishensis]